jgi:aspartate aminotransferase
MIILSGGEPDFRTPKPISDAAKCAIDKGRTHYSLGMGNIDLREKIAKKMREENGISAEAGQIVVTPGGKFALYMIMQALLNPEDEVILVTPTWVSYDPMILAAGGKTVPLELTEANGYTLTKELLESVVTEKTKAILICTPSNPTGHVIEQKEAEILADFLKETGIYCISDEIYERLSYGVSPFSVGSLERVTDQVITVMGFSKGYAMTGWRLGWICVPPDMTKIFSVLYSQSLSCTPTFIQDAAVCAFDCKSDIEEMRQSYEKRGKIFIDLLNGINGVHAEYPEGAFYAWVSFDRKGMTASEICQYLLEEARVAGVPGIAFGETADRHVRFSFAQAESDLIEAAQRIGKAMNKMDSL